MQPVTTLTSILYNGLVQILLVYIYQRQGATILYVSSDMQLKAGWHASCSRACQAPESLLISKDGTPWQPLREALQAHNWQR